MRRMTGLTVKERLGEWLAEFPLLRTMLLNPWFALAFVSLALLGLGILACLPKVWRSTPAGLRPEVKVSLLDLMQARALRASAERKAGKGDHLGAATAWQSALGNDQGNLDLYRGALRHLGQAPELPIKAVSGVLNDAGWVLRLGGTNRADVELMAVAFDKYGLAEEVYELLNPLADELSPGLEGAYLKALFSVGKYDAFAARWEAVQKRLPEEPELYLYRAAYLAGWGPPARAEEHLQKLKAAMDDVRLGAVADRLLMAASRHRLEPETFALALEREREASRDRITDHAAYWQLLDAVGRKDEARRLARDFNRSPMLASDVIVTAEALSALGLSDECAAYLQRHAADFGWANNRWSAMVWAAYADLLIARRDWEGLKNVATQMRSIPDAQEVLAGFAHFLDGRVAYANGAATAAEASFQEAVVAGFPLGRVGIRVAGSLLQMGYDQLALQALLPLEANFENDLSYWEAVFEAAYAARNDEALFLKAAQHAHELDPTSVQWQFNYAAALLAGQWRLEEALRLTMSVLARQPDLVVAQLNHVIALVLNGRAEDAAALLDRIDPRRLASSDASVYHLAAVGVNHALQNWPAVRDGLRALESERFFPKQQRWLDEIRRSLP